MSTSYYFFKTDNKTGKTVHICNGDHETERECDVHFISYLYGFMDGAIELVGINNFEIEPGEHDRSFRFTTDDGKKDVEYFMLFDEEGQNLIYELCKEETK